MLANLDVVGLLEVVGAVTRDAELKVGVDAVVEHSLLVLFELSLRCFDSLLVSLDFFV